MGTGHSCMAVFEIELEKFDSALQNASDKIAGLTLHYNLPGSDSIITSSFDVKNNFTYFKNADKSLRFATAVMMFGGLLKKSPLWKNYTWGNVIEMAKSSANMNDYAQSEFLSVADKAQKIYEPAKKKGKKRRTK